MIHANDPGRTSWISYDQDTDFPIQNIPFGIFQKEGLSPRLCSIIGDQVIDLAKVHELAFFNDLKIPAAIFQSRSLNDFISLGKEMTSAVRNRIAELFEIDSRWNAEELREHILHPVDTVDLLMPVRVGDYTDFYSSIEHATNVGSMFRDPDNALLPNWKHLPVGYHGRASSIVVSGTPVRRPNGQLKPQDDQPPVYGPSRLLDFELEMAFVVGRSNELGQPVPIQQAEDHIFGMMLFNDWSARDIQKWEYIPLGPFLGKSFASTVSPWVVTMDALEPFRVAGPEQDPPVLPYLRYDGKGNFNIQLEVQIQPAGGQAATVCRSNYKYMYWNMAQQLAHHTVNGCNMQVGDLCASGTISGSTPDSYGSMLELSWRGSRTVDLGGGIERKFIQNGDTVILKGYGKTSEGIRIGFGSCSGKVLPAAEVDA